VRIEWQWTGKNLVKKVSVYSAELALQKESDLWNKIQK
jgi:hypothetical protein